MNLCVALLIAYTTFLTGIERVENMVGQSNSFFFKHQSHVV